MANLPLHVISFSLMKRIDSYVIGVSQGTFHLGKTGRRFSSGYDVNLQIFWTSW